MHIQLIDKCIFPGQGHCKAEFKRCINDRAGLNFKRFFIQQTKQPVHGPGIHLSFGHQLEYGSLIRHRHPFKPHIKLPEKIGKGPVHDVAFLVGNPFIFKIQK